MKAKAGNGLCIIESKTGKDAKVRIGRNTDKQLHDRWRLSKTRKIDAGYTKTNSATVRNTRPHKIYR